MKEALQETYPGAFIRAGMKVYNTMRRNLRPVTQTVSTSPELKEIHDLHPVASYNICDHLPTIFSETVALVPRLIVELGVCSGGSRFALEKAASRTESFLVSVDIRDYSASCNRSDRWYFVEQNDIEFAKTFESWCQGRGIVPSIDVLFVDTSHLYAHTVQEINSWFPFLSSHCKVMFHDTNLRRFYRRLDGTIGPGWDNQRGVIRAIEDYLGARFNERLDFVTLVDNWLIRHFAHCNGFMVMERISARSSG